MRNRALMMAALMLVLFAFGACSKSEEGLDVAGLNLGKDLTKMLTEATGLLGGITDLDSAKAALPKLTEMESGLGDIVEKAAKLSPESKSAMSGMVKGAMPAFEAAVTKVGEMPGVGQSLKPTLDSMVSKLKGLF